jgi:hypothetical protein
MVEKLEKNFLGTWWVNVIEMKNIIYKDISFLWSLAIYMDGDTHMVEFLWKCKFEF